MQVKTRATPGGSPESPVVHRRRFLELGLAALAGRALASCSSSATAGTNGDAGAGNTSPSGHAGPDGADGSAGTDADAAAWATGGTAAMIDKANYPNPFASAAATTCALTCAMTEGPCYDADSETIQDISYGYAGLPVRMYFQVLDDACKPVPSATIDVWHVSAVGKYSGDDTANEDVAFCTGNDPDFTSHLYFRGKQATDENGVVYFDTCFPGWYSSRTVHVHLTISIGGQAYVTEQLFFEDALVDEIVLTQPLYDSRGARDTTNETDTVISPSAVGDYLFETKRMSDGAMLIWKTIVVMSKASGSLCTAPGGSAGAGGPGGPRDGSMGPGNGMPPGP